MVLSFTTLLCRLIFGAGVSAGVSALLFSVGLECLIELSSTPYLYNDIVKVIIEV